MPLSKSRVKSVEKIHGEFAKEAGAYYTEIQEVAIDFEVAFVDQTTFAEYIMSLANPSASYTFTIKPWDGPATIDYHPNAYNAFLSHGLGRETTEPLADDTRTLMAGICRRNLAQLEAAWKEVEKITVRDAEIETDPEKIDIAKPSDTVLLIGFEFNAPRHSGHVHIAYPHTTIEPVLPKLT